jgi:hypothetical protein
MDGVRQVIDKGWCVRLDLTSQVLDVEVSD